MTLWSVVEPIWLDFDAEVDRFIVSKDGAIRPADTLGKKAIPRAELSARIRGLIEEKSYSISQLAKELGISVTTVRRVCRTLNLGPYRVLESSKRRSRSSQLPYGWDVVQGELVESPEEQKWITKMKKMREAGESLHAIARFLNSNAVPTKNGGKWHAKTISQILNARR